MSERAQTFEELQEKYGFKEMTVEDGKITLNPIYKKHMNRAWEIQNVYGLLNNDVISLGKARELTSAIIESAIFVDVSLKEQETAKREAIIKDFENTINQRIAHLKDVDAEFCKDRWDMTKPENERNIYREMSNQVTATRQELEALKKILSVSGETVNPNPYQSVRDIATESYKTDMAAFAEGCGKPFAALAWHIYKRAFDIASYSLPKTKDGELLFTEKEWKERQMHHLKEFLTPEMTGAIMSLLRKSKGEFIICSAVKWQNTIICGRKHKNCYEIADALMTHGFLERERKNQGFMTSSGRYVDRAEAFKIAKANGQIVHKLFDGVEEGNLNSEDIFGED